MQLAKLLHSRGFFITFVNTDFTHKRLLRSRGLDSLDSLDDFSFETISDSKPPSVGEAIQDAKAFCNSVQENCKVPFRDLLKKLHHATYGPRVTCIIWDRYMTFTLQIAQELEIPQVMFCPTAACSFMAIAHFSELARRGITPLKGRITSNHAGTTTNTHWKKFKEKFSPAALHTTDVHIHSLKSGGGIRPLWIHCLSTTIEHLQYTTSVGENFSSLSNWKNKSSSCRISDIDLVYYRSQHSWFVCLHRRVHFFEESSNTLTRN